MKKISTLFKKDPNNLRRVINEINHENEWVFKTGIPTQKFDGTACAIINGKLYKRYDCKIDKKTGKHKKPIPRDAIPCQDPDPINGHHPHWVECDRNNPADKWHFMAFDDLENEEDGTYELCGEKVQGNPEGIKGHKLIKHGCKVLNIKNFSFENIKSYLESNDIEGIVFYDSVSNKMCKIKKSNFGIKR